MSFTDNDKNINYLGEFSEYSLEREFFHQDMQKAVRYIKPIVLMLGILNTLFLIPDYFLIHNRDTFVLLATGRVLFILLVMGLFVRLRYIKDYRVLAHWVTAYEATSILLFLFIYYQYESPNYLIQAFGVMIILIAVFMIPNRWINTIAVSLFLSIGFIAISKYYVENIKVSEFSAGVVYIGIAIMLFSIIAYRNNYYKRIQYINSKELVRLSTTDHLSGAYNRVKFDDELKRWVAYSKEKNIPLSLMILDFDNFKKINDIYGHLIGDNVIIETSALIMNSIRETDIFARWGGEEFVLLLPNTNKVHAVELTERLRISIESHEFKEVGRVTCSFGVAQLAYDDDIKSLMQKVDKMLYRAKRAGKNLVKS
jgi:diguanylate cyclase (GGDEF)-like protein